MGKLDGKITLVAGGAGYVGEGIVRAFLKEGATVIVSARNTQKLEELRGLLGELASDRFISILGDFVQLESAEHLRDEILNQFGRLDAVVASLGGNWQGNQPLTQVSMEDWQQYLQSNLTTHFVAARTFLPVLAQNKGSSYTLLGGGAGQTAIPNYSLVGIPAAGQLMLAKVIIEEMKGSGVRINEVVVHSLVATRATQGQSQPEWITADEI
ncbi:MAG TPA: dehydrogenase, partial [Cyanobacteria bacterium UBA8553]|nr:dehydrogenase [Cyanobacteria bacterium UBA8553]